MYVLTSPAGSSGGAAQGTRERLIGAGQTVPNSLNIAYIAGTSYSGSTLLTMLLNRLPGITTVGEVAGQLKGQRSPDFQCSCGELVISCDFWNRLGHNMEEGFGPLNLGTTFYDVPGPMIITQLLNSHLGLPSLNELRDDLLRHLVPGSVSYREVLRRNIELMQATLLDSNASVFVDVSKNFIRLDRLTASDQLSVSVIHLVRDPVTFSNSVMRRGGRNARKAAHWWNSMLRQADYHQKRYSGQWIRIRYEDLVASPEEECDKLAAFLGLERPPSSRGNFRDFEHHIFGNGMRLSQRREVTSDDTWRTEMTPADIRIVKRLTTRGRQLLGYE
jgi:hypothetical protein